MIANVGDLPYVIIIAVVVLIGGSQLPKIARNIGLAGKEFRKAQTEAEEEHAKAAANPAGASNSATSATNNAPTPPPPVALPASPPASGAAQTEAGITLTPAQLDALLKAREEQVRNEPGSN